MKLPKTKIKGENSDETSNKKTNYTASLYHSGVGSGAAGHADDHRKIIFNLILRFECII